MLKSSIDEFFNIEILGDSVNKCQHDMPLEDDPNGTGRRLGVINFENSKVRKMLCSIDKIIDVCHVNNDVKLELKSALDYHIRAFAIVRKMEMIAHQKNYSIIRFS